MEHIPARFVADVVTLALPFQDFLGLSGQWRRAAQKRLEKEFTLTCLDFRKVQGRSEISFRFGCSDNSMWEDFRNSRLGRCICMIRFSEQTDDVGLYPPHSYPLDNENTRLLRRYLMKSSYAVESVLLSIPRIGVLVEDYFGNDCSLSREILKSAVQRGSLMDYRMYSGTTPNGPYEKQSCYDHNYVKGDCERRNLLFYKTGKELEVTVPVLDATLTHPEQLPTNTQSIEFEFLTLPSP
uniref:F-box domain-containing protein n=1 Tax=Steinernema glaseri TaxID=37863 RepID=A0A1I7ZEY5_9BILA